jgi:hypothetical protein
MPKNLLLYATWEEYLNKGITSIRSMQALGWTVKDRIVYEKDLDVVKNKMEDCQCLMIHNGYRLNGNEITSLARSMDMRVIYTELGYLPQAGSVTVDTKGLFCKSSLNDSIEWINQTNIDECKRYIENHKFYKPYLSKKHNEDYILCVGQLDWDAQILECSENIRTINLIEECVKYREKYSLPIKFRPHPRLMGSGRTHEISILKQKTAELDIEFVMPDISDRKKTNILEDVKNAKVVVGMNSTSLVDAMAINKPVIAIVDCPIKKHINDKNKTYDEESRYRLLAAFNESQYYYTDKDKCTRILQRLGF